jgi:hypothetical protein
MDSKVQSALDEYHARMKREPAIVRLSVDPLVAIFGDAFHLFLSLPWT